MFCPNLAKIGVYCQILVQTPKYKISRNYAPWEPRCFVQTEGRTDVTCLIVVFRSCFANAPIDDDDDDDDDDNR